MSIIEGIKENVLIDRIVKGDQAAFEIIFKFYYPGLVVFATQFVMNEDDAEEIVQDFFVHLWNMRDNLHQSDSLKSYFFTAIKNRSLNHLKKRKVAQRLIDRLKERSTSAMSYNTDLFIESELQNKIRNSFKSIPPKTKEVFFLSRLTGLSNTEISERLHISKRTVETHISKALKILKTELKDYLVLLIFVELFF